jgi:hypothetical protein
MCIGNLVPRKCSWCDSVFFVWAKRLLLIEIDRQLIDVCSDRVMRVQHIRMSFRESKLVEQLRHYDDRISWSSTSRRYVKELIFENRRVTVWDLSAAWALSMQNVNNTGNAELGCMSLASSSRECLKSCHTTDVSACSGIMSKNNANSME